MLARLTALWLLSLRDRFLDAWLGRWRISVTLTKTQEKFGIPVRSERRVKSSTELHSGMSSTLGRKLVLDKPHKAVVLFYNLHRLGNQRWPSVLYGTIFGTVKLRRWYHPKVCTILKFIRCYWTNLHHCSISNFSLCGHVTQDWVEKPLGFSHQRYLTLNRCSMR